jgi:uncharacterized 2Fe-2S/4Fe-4S cluster protein (DUF4445 family)
MRKYRVSFYPMGVVEMASHGERIIDIARRAGVHIESSCGGEGHCGKCQVIVEKGRVESGISPRLSKRDITTGVRLACLARIMEDLLVRVPFPLQPLEIERSFGFDRMDHLKISPIVQRIELSLSPPTKEDNIDDLARIQREFKRRFGLTPRVEDISILRKLGKVLRKGNFKIGLKVLFDEGAPLIVDLFPTPPPKRSYAICVDVGTTTVASLLVQLENGRVLDVSYEYNRQMMYGEDVISRILYSTKRGGLKRLQGLVVETINTLIHILVDRNNIDLQDVLCLVVAGNTTMIHLLLGVDPRYLRLSPYVPTCEVIPPLPARGIGLKLPKKTYLFFFPSVASYMGGDVVGGILGTGIYRKEEPTLYIDIGTNSEVVLGNREYLLCCSTSAGPAFEGGGIRCGMRAARGAIEEVRIDEHSLTPHIKTIKGERPRGICGSGLVDVVAELLRVGVLDRRGKIDLSIENERVRLGERGPEYVLVFGEETSTGNDIVIDEVDLDNLIRAKGAIFAGISLLLKRVGLDLKDLDQIIVSGNLGQNINIGNGIEIGLFPPFRPDGFLFVGEGPLLGARHVALSHNMYLEAVKISRSMTNIELSDDPGFIHEYTAALFLPHTDLRRWKDEVSKVRV